MSFMRREKIEVVENFNVKASEVVCLVYKSYSKELWNLIEKRSSQAMRKRKAWLRDNGTDMDMQGTIKFRKIKKGVR